MFKNVFKSFFSLVQVGLVYMFNLIVGTGALTMPRAFATAGWVVSLALISFLGFMRCVLVYLKAESTCAVHCECLNLFFMFSPVSVKNVTADMLSANICAVFTVWIVFHQ